MCVALPLALKCDHMSPIPRDHLCTLGPKPHAAIRMLYYCYCDYSHNRGVGEGEIFKETLLELEACERHVLLIYCRWPR